MSANEGSNFSVFENLELIPLLIEKIDLLSLEVNELKKSLNKPLDLTKRIGVQKYLGVSKSTMFKYMREGELKEGKHFTKKLVGKCVKITFVESAVINYKESRK